MDTHHIVAGSARLAAFTAGEGAPVAFLHAGVADSRMWRRQVEALPSGFRAIAYDRRGFGVTKAPAEDHSQIGDLHGVLDALAPGAEAVLIGCSQGGRLAIDFALSHPERVRGLLLFAPAVSGARPAEHGHDIAGRLARLDAAEDSGDLYRINELEAELWLDGPLGRPGRVAGEARALFLEMNGRALRAGDVGTNTDTGSAYDRLGQIAAPTLVICGDLDFPHLQARCVEMAAAVPGARSLLMPGVAHLPSLELPGETSRIIVEFLSGLG